MSQEFKKRLRKYSRNKIFFFKKKIIIKTIRNNSDYRFQKYSELEIFRKFSRISRIFRILLFVIKFSFLAIKKSAKSICKFFNNAFNPQICLHFNVFLYQKCAKMVR